MLKLFKIKRVIRISEYKKVYLFCKKKKKRKKHLEYFDLAVGLLWQCKHAECACALSARGLRDVTSNSVRSVVAGDFPVFFCRSSSYSEEKH